MKKKIDAVFVVEGKSDVAFLESFLEADFVITNGSAISEETILYLQALKEKRTVIVLTDPDFPGLQIRKKLDERISGLKHVYIPKETAIKKHKVGVAESTKEEVLRALESLEFVGIEQHPSDLEMIDLIDLGVVGKEDSQQKREEIARYFHIGFAGNNKSLLKKLKSLGVCKKDLLEMEKQYDRE